MERKHKPAFVLRLAGLTILFEGLFLLVALMLSWDQLSWIGLFSNLFLTSLLSLSLLFGLFLFSSGTIRQRDFITVTFMSLKFDGSQVGKLAFWLATVIAFFASMLLALRFMN
jgi:hypothetical protein